MIRTVLVSAAVGFLVVAVQVALWAIDRRGPYDRLFGMVVAEDPDKCGPEVTDRRPMVVPGACVAIEWTLTDIYTQECQPVSSRHVSRVITDDNGRHELPKTENVYGGNKRQFTNPLRRPFVLPDFSIPGPSTYHSVACFNCNPLQWAINWPVCKGTPDAHYVVEQP